MVHKVSSSFTTIYGQRIRRPSHDMNSTAYNSTLNRANARRAWVLADVCEYCVATTR